jgi:sugar phosphate isomerase/epimerase
MWTFGISEVTTWPWSYEEDLVRYAELGARAIEVWEFKLAEGAGARREQLAKVRSHGLAATSFQADVHSLLPTRMRPEPASLDARRDAFLQTLELAAPMMPGAVFVLNTGTAQDGDVQRAFDTTVRAYRDLARRAADAGVRLAVEPLHPLAMNEDTFAWNLEDARELVEAVGHEALGICADIWNLAGQHDLRAGLAACGDRIFVAQVSDYRRPRSYLDRLAVGDGSLDFAPFLAGLHDARFAGPVVLEIFSNDVADSLYDGDLHAVVSRSRDALTDIIGAPPRG